MTPIGGSKASYIGHCDSIEKKYKKMKPIFLEMHDAFSSHQGTRIEKTVNYSRSGAIH